MRIVQITPACLVFPCINRNILTESQNARQRILKARHAFIGERERHDSHDDANGLDWGSRGLVFKNEFATSI